MSKQTLEPPQTNLLFQCLDIVITLQYRSSLRGDTNTSLKDDEGQEQAYEIFRQ